MSMPFRQFNKATDGLSRCPVNPYSSSESESNTVLEDFKIPYTIKNEAQSICNVIEGRISLDWLNIPEVTKITVQDIFISVLNPVSLAILANEQTKDPVLRMFWQYVLKSGNSKG